MFEYLKKTIAELIEQEKLKRILIALSGGADSQALTHILLSFRNSIEIGIAHVDHGWRVESQEEAHKLMVQVKSWKIPFYLKTLRQDQFKGNLEQFCREERLKFFQNLCTKYHYQGVFLGHHQDDQAETVLKRIFEGSSLQGIIGMQKSSYIDQMLVLRPFLEISKKTLLSFLEKEKITFFEDRTNHDTRFLRAKMRKHIVPELNRVFGKIITAPLTRLSQECSELNIFMQKRFRSVLNEKNILDCRSIDSNFELKWLLREWLKIHQLSASYVVLENMVELIKKRKFGRKFIFHGQVVKVDCGQLYISQTINPLPRI